MWTSSAPFGSSNTNFQFPFTLNMFYGHPDDWLSFKALPRLAPLNVEMDQLAKDRLVSLYC
jgi:hypothetical protein